MITHFKSALNQIKAEDELKINTKKYLKNQLEKNNSSIHVEIMKRRLFIMKKKSVVILAIIAIFTLTGGTSAYAYYQTPVSYLSLDINPSVELGVNAFGKVVSTEAYNDDGKTILSGTDVTGSNVTDAVEELVTSAVDNGFIANDGSSVISVTSETNDSEVATNLENDAEEGANVALNKSHDNGKIIKDNVALARRDEARALGITPGKLNLINKLQKVVATATVAEYKDATVKEIMKTIKENRENTNSKKKDDTKVESITTTGQATNNEDSINSNATQNKDSNNEEADNSKGNNENSAKANKVEETTEQDTSNNTDTIENANVGTKNSNSAKNDKNSGNNGDKEQVQQKSNNSNSNGNSSNGKSEKNK